VACCYRDPKYLTDGNTRRVVMMAEAFADGLVDAAALDSVTGYDSDEDPALEAAMLPGSPDYPFVHHTARAAEMVSVWGADPVGNERGTLISSRRLPWKKQHSRISFAMCSGTPSAWSRSHPSGARILRCLWRGRCTILVTSARCRFSPMRSKTSGAKT